MKITACEAWPVSLELEEPFSIAYSTIDHAVNWFLRVETDAGVTGFGCAAPDEEVTGENETTIGKALNETIIPILKGQDLDFLTKILEELRTWLGNQPTALASADMALMDLLSKKAGLPLYRMLGGYRSSMPTSVTVGIQPVEDTVRKALQWRDRGFKVLKIKGGRELEEDIEKIVKLREALGSSIELRFDANQGYTIANTLRFIRETAGAGLEFIEQPTPKDDFGAFAELRRETGDSVRIMADESVLGPESALVLACTGMPDLYNIKLTKTGGIRRAVQLDSVAAAAGAGTMVGCMDEAGLGVSAGLAFALSSSNVLYADLDGHLEFTNDPTFDAVRIQDGIIYPVEKPGLGIEL